MSNYILAINEVFKNCNSYDKKDFSAIIPAAGKGTRLKTDQPKILYKILGKPLLSWLIDLIKPCSYKLVFVLSPSNKKAVVEEIKKNNITYEIAIQKSPLGMADAILSAEPFIKTKNVFVIWGDQITLKKSTIEACLLRHSMKDSPSLTIPTFLKDNPYISFERDFSGKITTVYEKREASYNLEHGESDCGFFVFQTKELFEELKHAKERKENLGKTTGEFNLLPLVPNFNKISGGIATIRIEDALETQGINNLEEAMLVENILKNRLEPLVKTKNE